MTSIDKYTRRLYRRGKNLAESLKNNADRIKDSNFERDVAYKKCYILKKDQVFPRQNEQEYRRAKEVFFGRQSYDPRECDQFEQVDCKFSVHLYKAISSSDDPDYYLEFRPNAHATNKNIRVGALVFIPDDIGVYNLWMIVATDKRPQFPQYYVLQVNWLLKFGRYDQKVTGYDRPQVFFQWCVNRARNSYNSGVWTDYISTSVENQDAIWMPTSAISRKIWYGTKILMDDEFTAYGKIVSWQVSKVERTHPLNITKLTVTQELYDDEDWTIRMIDTEMTTDSLDRETGYDYYYSGRPDGEGADKTGRSDIAYSGTGTIKLGFSKTFTAHFYNSELGLDVGENALPIWEIVLKDGETYTTDTMEQIDFLVCSADSDNDTLTIKCKKDYNLIGEMFLVRVKDANNNRVSTVEIEVIG